MSLSTAKSYWTKISKTKQQQFNDKETIELLNLLPNFKDKNVLELGSGSGRFTGHFAKSAKNVITVDFIEEYVNQNKNTNGHYSNVDFLCENVVDLEFENGKFDVIFSNLLMMYLPTNEMTKFFTKILKWLKPGGHFMFSECCGSNNDGSGIIYRKSSEYTNTVSGFCHSYDNKESGLDIVFMRTLDNRSNSNKNQIIWLTKKVERDLVAKQGLKTFQEFLDKKQYSKNGILRYERIFGKDYISSGGYESTIKFYNEDLQQHLKNGMKILDIGCGVGGSAFLLREKIDCDILGVDLSVNMIEIANDKLDEYKYDNIRFEVSDATTRDFPASSFDFIYSRDTILHIQDKPKLFKNFFKWLKPGGMVFITDYCAGPKQDWNAEFSAYVKSRGYDLHTPSEYGNILKNAGFQTVVASDVTNYWREILSSEVVKLNGPLKNSFLKDFSQKDMDDLVAGWESKLKRVDAGHQKWGKFFAKKC